MAAGAGDNMRAIDGALAENQSHPVVGPLRTEAFLDRVFPSTTKGDYKAFDKAERAAVFPGLSKQDVAGLTPNERLEIGLQGAGVKDVLREMDFYRRKQNRSAWSDLSDVSHALTRARSKATNDITTVRHFPRDLPNGYPDAAAYEREVSEKFGERQTELAAQSDDIYSGIKQVGAQTPWTTMFGSSHSDWLTPEDTWDDVHATNNHAKFGHLTTMYDPDLSLENEPALLWQEAVLGHRRVKSGWGEDNSGPGAYEPSPPISMHEDDIVNEDSEEPHYTHDDFPDPHEVRRTDGRPWSERRREVFPEDYDEHGNLLPGL
jgi:hypothetical protein